LFRLKPRSRIIYLKAQIPEDKKATEYLANERTFLAWVRTSIAVISLGFVVAKFGLWLHEISARVDPQALTRGTGASLPVGVAIMMFGGVLALLAAGRFHVVNKAIDKGEVQIDHRLVMVVTLGMTALAGGMIAYIVLTVGHDL